MPFGKITGLAIGIFIANYFILPHGVLQAFQSQPIASTGIERLLVALVITIVTVALFHFLDKR